MTALAQQGSIVVERAAEIVLTLGLSIGAALLLLTLRRKLATKGFGGRSAASVARRLALVPGVLSLGCFYVSDRYHEVAGVRRPAAIFAIVLCGLMVGIFAEGSKAGHSADDTPVP